MHALSAVTLACCISLLPAAAAAAPLAKVSFLSGSAEAGPEGKTRKLSVGSRLEPGDTVSTGKNSRVELTLTDGSRVRLASEARLTLSHGTFDGKKRERVSLKLWAGRVWASVVKATGGASSFEVETENAVSGVRGTSFAVLASADASALVRVYSGSVGVRPAAAAGPRKQVAGPREIDRRQWEEIIATAMKQVRVSAVGEISPAEDFEDEGESLKWAQWNRERDAGQAGDH